jgi:hypothetical protein
MNTLGITRFQQPRCTTKLAASLATFDSLPDYGGVTIQVGCATTGRSRASIYRDIAAGRIEAFKISGSTRLRVGSLRRLLAGSQS